MEARKRNHWFTKRLSKQNTAYSPKWCPWLALARYVERYGDRGKPLDWFLEKLREFHHAGLALPPRSLEFESLQVQRYYLIGKLANLRKDSTADLRSIASLKGKIIRLAYLTPSEAPH